ncbi:hypothetical protein ST42_09075 [Prevotella pectinovora]|nr:hypothetical protein ST42_09075 [Prevotella pectinovora]
MAEETYTCAREKTIRKEDNIILILFATKSKSIAQVKAAIKVNTELLRLFFHNRTKLMIKSVNLHYPESQDKESGF